MQKNEVRLSHAIHKINFRWIKDLSVITKSIPLVGKNIGMYLHDLELGNSFLDKTPKHKKHKKN